MVGIVTSKSAPELRSTEDDEGGELAPEDFDDVPNRHNEDAEHDEDGNPDFFEGDIVEGKPEDRDAEFNKKWPKAADGLVYIPYTIPSNFPTASRQELANAAAEYEKNTCVR